jgi:hypothetical protein
LTLPRALRGVWWVRGAWVWPDQTAITLSFIQIKAVICEEKQ